MKAPYKIAECKTNRQLANDFGILYHETNNKII